MAILYSRTGATLHEDPEHGRFKPGDGGAFTFPDDLSDQLLRQHVRKKRMWEDEEMRADRMHGEAERRERDPAVLYAAVSELVQLSKTAQGAAGAPDLAAELAELRKELAEMREQNAAAGDGGNAGDSGNAGSKPASRRKPAGAAAAG